MPLPKQIEITHEVIAPGNDVDIVYPGDSPLLAQQTSSVFRQALSRELHHAVARQPAVFDHAAIAMPLAALEGMWVRGKTLLRCSGQTFLAVL